MSEAGLRRQSATEVVLNENTDMLMVGQEVWVDGSKKGRIAYLGSVHFSKGEMAGIHLDEPVGKNNGTVGGILYFQVMYVGVTYTGNGPYRSEVPAVSSRSLDSASLFQVNLNFCLCQ